MNLLYAAVYRSKHIEAKTMKQNKKSILKTKLVYIGTKFTFELL